MLASWRVLPWLVALTLAACATLPTERSAAPSYALTDTAGTALGRLAERALAGLQGPTGVHLLSGGHDAFLARLALAETAERSLDAQYFIWHGDNTGQLLIAAFLRAADRGLLGSPEAQGPEGPGREGRPTGTRGGVVKFWDTSAIVALCVQEPHSAAVKSVVLNDPSIGVWWATRTECVSAIVRQAREGGLSPTGERQARDVLETLVKTWVEIQPTDALPGAAERLLAVHPLRAADAFQLAAALEFCRGQPCAGS